MTWLIHQSASIWPLNNKTLSFSVSTHARSFQVRLFGTASLNFLPVHRLCREKISTDLRSNSILGFENFKIEIKLLCPYFDSLTFLKKSKKTFLRSIGRATNIWCDGIINIWCDGHFWSKFKIQRDFILENFLDVVIFQKIGLRTDHFLARNPRKLCVQAF